MTGNYRLTPRALEDLKSIGRYTLRQWGVRQRNQYLQDLVLNGWQNNPNWVSTDLT
ncbi:hypothetical protein CRENPOLYSF2_1100007 [Crenothrix polyspora]|uniref:Type II toxin-antitoxin system RelE/ParE family toxin n=1 Tax=Crenothrix polyspora TaxID=360316 RepID=A0A1R4GZQ3_9GAMM|nr:type II toxin-antitoxin system RelE/ParE family toxin [Crenothrix polyspora]SJM89300.1 hypothetical protein CRENPOLYSF2_1100007 [Crenothrix polyspora]